MTRKERLRRCYFHEELDRPAVYVRTSYPPGDSSYDRLKSYLETHSELKLRWSGVSRDPVPPVESRTEPHSEDFVRQVQIIHTPKGDLERSHLESLKGQPGLHERYLLKSPEDAEKYLSLPVPAPAMDAESFPKAVAQMGDRGIVDVNLGMNPAGFVAELFGSENFAMISATDRDVLHALCQRRMDWILQQVKFLLDHQVGPFFSMAGEEYLVPPLHGLKDFNDFNVRYDRPIIDLIHNSGGRIHIHSHGSIGKVLQSFIDMGTDVLHPFEAPPMGDITPAEAKKLARSRLCLEGNLQISRMYEASPGEIRKETEQLIRDAFDDHRGLIVAPTASPYIRNQGEVCFARFQAMVDTVVHWKG